jgi:preprotein translocase subunit SecD
VEKASDAIQQVLRDRNAAGSALAGTSALYEVTLDEKGAGRVLITETGELRLLDRLIEQAISVIRRRIDETGVREPTVQRQGRNRILVQVPGVEDPEEIKTLIGKTAKMTFHMVNHDLGQQGDVATRGGTVLPRGTILIEHNDYRDQNSQVAQFVAVRENVELDGEKLADATQCFDQNTGLPAVCFRWNTEGARTFCRITRENIGRRFAAVLDDKAVTAPTIQAAICDGSGIITGNFTIQSASRIALLLRAGALPVDLKVVEERTVGPGLGQDNIDAGKIASILGMIFVVIFMGVAYGRFGLMANVALIINLVLIAGALSLLQATLTLPGIAGIVLTIGMAVDANVLIFERIREEVRSGRTPLSAIDTGYRRAMTTIIDSNLTTFIAAMLLFLFGSGPVQGFGVTLAIGLATSMFTAIMVTRLLVVTWWRIRRPAALPI